MSEESGTEQSLFDHAVEQEKSYDWLGAAESYDKALGLIPKQDVRRISELLERKAYALYKAAFQSDSHDQFVDRISKSIGCYLAVAESVKKTGFGVGAGIAQRCEAMAKYLGYWQVSKYEDKKSLVSEAWTLAKESLDFFRSSGDAIGFCQSYNLLTPCTIPLINYMDNQEAKTAVINGVIAFGEYALNCIPRLADPFARALAYVRASSYMETYASDFVDVKDGIKLDKAARDLWDKAREISEEITYSETATTFSYGMPSVSDPDEPGHVVGKALEFGRKANDRLVIGTSLDWLAQISYYRLAEAIDSDELDAAAAQSLDLCLRAQDEFAILQYVYWSVNWVWSPYPEPWHCAHLSVYTTDPKKKRELAEKVLNGRTRLQEVASASGYPEVMCDANLVITIALTSLAKTESNLEKKKGILEEALRIGGAQQAQWDRLHPFHVGSRAFSGNMVADTEFELASLEKDAKLKAEKLRKALLSRSKAIELAERFLEDPSAQQPKFFRLVGLWHSGHGACASNLYEVTNDKKDLEVAIHSFEAAAEYFSKAGQPSRCAESYWKSAQAFDVLGVHLKSSERFTMASESYKQAFDSIPRLKNLYRDYSLYMQAWSEIERARHHHARQDAGAAKDSYEKASRLHEATERWKFLAPNYLAWAEVENGEYLSRKEMSKEAVLAFGRAARLFVETKESLGRQVDSIHNEDERENVNKLVKAADLRRKFCKGRLALEEARVLDKEGDEYGSSMKFGSAAETFEKLRADLDSDQDRLEIQFITTLSKAWQTMARAETDSSPELYDDASQLFEQAKDLSVGEKAKLLALGHSRFCRALAAGMRFADTGDASLHVTATQNLESAAKHYLKAGLENDSEYAKASKLLFDAYVYMDRANREEDQEKKAKLYAMTEKVLEASAESYSKADYPKKRDQVQKLLEKVKGERELAVTLMEVLHAPDASSNTMGVVSPRHETAVGLQRFEHADVQATVFARPKEMLVGDSLSLEIELVNAGKGTAQLTKVEEVVPHGFEMKEAPSECRFENSCLNMRGRRLDPLKTEDLKVVLKPTVQGRFMLMPRIMYLDDAGKYKSCVPEPVEVTVKELGISGWIKGSDRR